MTAYQYDFLVIGAGSGGVRAARMAAGFGARTAIVEERHLGGTCVNVGCVPKKLLVYASRYAQEFAVARSFGWQADGIRCDWPLLIRNKNREIERLNGVYQRLLDQAGVTVIRGHATVRDRKSTRLNSSHMSESRMPSSA